MFLGVAAAVVGDEIVPGDIEVADRLIQRVGVVGDGRSSSRPTFEASRFYQPPPEASVPVLQLTYDDDVGRFPWDEGFTDSESQPRPGAFSA
jgi:hypothetical protein